MAMYNVVTGGGIIMERWRHKINFRFENISTWKSEDQVSWEKIKGVTSATGLLGYIPSTFSKQAKTNVNDLQCACVQCLKGHLSSNIRKDLYPPCWGPLFGTIFTF